MSELVTVGSTSIASMAPAVALPQPRIAINVRIGTTGDVPFVDALMKKHSKQLAFLTRETLEGKVSLGHVLIAQTSDGRKAGYLIGNDRYKSRDELGVIYQVCVAPEFRRMLVGAHLIKARFESSAYGCKLYCCWCAQDLTGSNEFYESMGFRALAFRAGSAKRDRVHIFWQKRIREGDTETPWWFPSETRGGLMDAARIALPIPPGMTWRDELPRLIPEKSAEAEAESVKREPKSRPKTPVRAPNGFYLGPLSEVEVEAKPQKPKRVKKADPVLAAKARELRDRYLEQFNAASPALASGKYDVVRLVEANVGIDGTSKLLAA